MDYISEVWRDVKGFEGLYMVSNIGRVRSFTWKMRGKIMSSQLDKWGYLAVGLHDGKRHKRELIHRLVAYAFIPNMMDKPGVNHINGDKQDNRAENLEWATQRENNNHSIIILNNPPVCASKPVKQIAPCGNVVREYKSIKSTREYGFYPQHVAECCHGRRNIHKGFYWAFK